MIDQEPAQYLKKKILSKLYSSEFLDATANEVDNFVLEFPIIDKEKLREQLDALQHSGLIENKIGRLSLTAKGRGLITVVMTGGSFDIIHPGHVETLEKAKSLGDVLVVSVARNSTFIKNKKRNPLHDERLRKKLVSSLRSVDVAVLGSEVDIFETAILLKPDIVALGYDQSHNEAGIQEELKKRGLQTQVVRLDSSVPEIKSSRIALDYY